MGRFRFFCRVAVLAAGISAPAMANADAPLNSELLLPKTGASAGNTVEIIGEIRFYHARHQDTLVDLARKFNLGYVELVAANPDVDPWLPGEGTQIVVPGAHILPEGPREGIIINLPEQRLYYFPAKGGVVSYPIGTGREGWNTPTGTTKVTGKRPNPTWTPPASIREEQPDLPKVVPAGPNNPLGTHAIYLAMTNYLIHGTNRPYGVGRRVSHGCIRLYPEDITRLFESVAVGTPVTILNQAMKLTWLNGELFLEAHPDQSQIDEIEAKGKLTPVRIPEFEYRILKAAGAEKRRLHWPTIRQAADERRGIPIRITTPEPETKSSAPRDQESISVLSPDRFN